MPKEVDPKDTMDVCGDSLWGTADVPLDHPERF